MSEHQPPSDARPATLADRLQAARERHFVGRIRELELFRDCITSAAPPFAVLHVHGPGGVGKSTLLERFQREAARLSIPCHQIDGANIDPTPEAFTRAVDATGVTRSPGRGVLLVDTYEALAPLDDWLRSAWMPGLPADVLVVLAGREPPSIEWREDPGWHALLHPISLRNLREDETAALLSMRATPGHLHSSIHACTQGHPLATALLADMIAAGDIGPDDDLHGLPPSVVRILLERFLRDIVNEQQRTVLEFAAHMRVVSAGLLRAIVGDDDGEQLFDWLRRLSFMHESADGLVMHDLVRESIDRDLKWRDRDRYREMHRELRRHYLDAFWQGPEGDRPRVFRDILYLHRNNPVFAPFYSWSPHGLRQEQAQEADRAAIVEIIERFEGMQSAAIADYWFDRQREAFKMIVDRDGTAHGFVAHLLLRSVEEADLAADPVLAALWEHLQRNGALRHEEVISLGRFWADRESYHTPGPVDEVLSVSSAVLWMTQPHLAWSGVVMPDIEYWAPMFTYIDFPPVPELAVEVDGRAFHAVAHDWRTRPVAAWLDVMGERELDDDIDLSTLVEPPQVVVLSEPDFEAAVRAVLRNYRRPDLLSGNPLLRSRLALEAAGDGEPVAATLLALVHEAAVELEAHPRDIRLYRALEATFFQPAPTQEAAAERLDLPFSTYRRYLTAGIRRVVSRLWEQELHGSTPHAVVE